MCTHIMADIGFENPTSDPDGPGKDDDSFDLPDPPLDPIPLDPPLDLPLDVQQWLNASGNRIQSKKIINDQELIQSDPTSCPQNQKGNN